MTNLMAGEMLVQAYAVLCAGTFVFLVCKYLLPELMKKAT